MKFHLNRNIDIRETGLVLQPKLFWLAASPDGLVSDKSNEDVRKIGLIEIKCPKSKKNSKIDDLVHDQSFYVKYEDGVPVLKRDHPNGYYTQIQMAMGLVQLYNSEHISKLEGGQRELEEHTLQNLLEVVSLVRVLHNNFLVGTV